MCFYESVVGFIYTSTSTILIYIYNPYPNLHLTRAYAKLYVWLRFGFRLVFVRID